MPRSSPTSTTTGRATRSGTRCGCSGASASRSGPLASGASGGARPSIASARELLRRIDPASGRAAGDTVPGPLLWTLGAGAFGLAFSLTVVAAYLPSVLEKFTDSRVLIGLVLGAEGIFALTLPLLVGPLSDRTWSDYGRRLPYLLWATPFMVVPLAVVPFAPSLVAAALILAVFFAAYYVYEPPYRSLYPDLLERRVMGRANGVQHVLRGAALGGGLILGGVLFGWWRPLPFLLAAAVVVGATEVVRRFVDERGGRHAGEVDDASVRESFREPARMFRADPTIRWFLFANSAWEFTFAGMRTFVVLYVIRGLDEPIFVSTAILAAVAGGYVLAAVVAGRIGDAVGIGRVILACSFVYGGGLVVAGLASTWRWPYLAAVFLVSITAGAIMTLAWGLLYRLMPEEHRGSSTALGTVTRGIGLVLGPLVVGGAIDVASQIAFFEGTEGYAVMWPVVGLPVLLVTPFVLRLTREEDRRREA